MPGQPKGLLFILTCLLAVSLAACAGPGRDFSTPSPAPPTAQPSPTPEARPDDNALLDRISEESLLGHVERLSAIEPHSGWRSSGSTGESQAVDYVAGVLDSFTRLKALGLTVEREPFNVFMTTEIWASSLVIATADGSHTIPASGLRGPRDDVAQARRFDSDGQLGDTEHDPVSVSGPVVVIDSEEGLRSDRNGNGMGGRIVFLDYALVDRSLVDMPAAISRASLVMDNEPAGLVLVTRYSNVAGDSHGTFAGDVSVFNWVDGPRVPVVTARLEDFAPAGIRTLSDLRGIESATLTLDADVLAPGRSQNLIARIPGDDGRALILGAHIDSANSPGAMDDASGSAILLEIARILDEANYRPRLTTYLVWFGSEEAGLYGSYSFVAEHQDLLDRTVAMIQIDCLTHPLDGIQANIELSGWPYGHYGREELPLNDYLIDLAPALDLGSKTVPTIAYWIESDNSGFTGFDVPNLNMIYLNTEEMEAAGGVHYAANIHSPYDTPELVMEERDVFRDMARLALAAVLSLGREAPDLRVFPPPDKRAVFVGSETEAVHMAPTAFTELGLALATSGFDADLIPYGQPATAQALAGADVVIALPVVDYSTPDVPASDAYDAAWTDEQVQAMVDYVAGGGLLVLANSGHRLKYNNMVEEQNEDWADMNALAERFGVRFEQGSIAGQKATVQLSHPLVQGVAELELAEGNAVPFALEGGLVLAAVGSQPVVALVDYGRRGGQVLVLGDVGLLGSASREPANKAFWLNLAEYATHRRKRVSVDPNGGE